MAVKKKSSSQAQPAKRGYGWVPDLPDRRDILYAAPVAAVQALPTKVDLRPNCPPEVYDQGQLGSCTGNAIAGAIEFDRMKQNLTPVFTPSRLFIYYNERVMEGTVSSDSGAQIRDGIKSVGKQGAPPETGWPHLISKFKTKPPASVYKTALKYKVALYQRLVQNLNQLRGCLASGFPFVFGFTVYESFESQAVASTGVVPMPASNEQVLGGHAVLAVGYDDSQSRFIVRNSWGSTWGMAGYFTMPYAYLLDSNLADDLWTIRLV
jgi:C1A family cysteine protease